MMKVQYNVAAASWSRSFDRRGFLTLRLDDSDAVAEKQLKTLDVCPLTDVNAPTGVNQSSIHTGVHFFEPETDFCRPGLWILSLRQLRERLIDILNRDASPPQKKHYDCAYSRMVGYAYHCHHVRDDCPARSSVLHYEQDGLEVHTYFRVKNALAKMSNVPDL